MEGVTRAQAKRDFRIGWLTKWRIERLMGDSGWAVWLGEGAGAGWLVDAREKEPCVYRSLDAAVRALEDVGFQVGAVFQG